ncbi:MAG: hypothetical protein GWP03_00590, partial [Proteobacteria bacterium]|nr:hypothetical protein [Pseudomonadota bacterium]
MEKKRVIGILGVIFVFVMMFSSCSLFNNLFNKSRHERITNNPGRSCGLDIVEDSKGVIHGVWMDRVDSIGRADDIFYSYRMPGGGWSEPVDISNTEDCSYLPRLAINSKDELYAVWEERLDSGPYYISTVVIKKMESNGNWQEGHDTLWDYLDFSESAAITIDNEDNIHITFLGQDSQSNALMYCEIENNGQKDSIVHLIEGPMNYSPILVDRSGGLHVVGEKGFGMWDEIMDVYKPAGGTWQIPGVNISQSPYSNSWIVDNISMDKDGHIYTSWEECNDNHIYFSERDISGDWSTPEDMGNGGISWTVCDREGCVYLGYSLALNPYVTDNTNGFIRKRNKEGKWSEPINISYDKTTRTTITSMKLLSNGKIGIGLME